MTITYQQVALLMKNLKKHTQQSAAAKAGMDVKTARKYLQAKQLPTDLKATYHRSKPMIFDQHWPEIVRMLAVSPSLQAQTLMAYLIRQYPDTYRLGQLRTLQRQIQVWRTQHGSSEAVIFRQTLTPGKQSQSDYTSMNALNITIARAPFKHLLFQWILPYSRWESVMLCFSESFDSLVLGYEKAAWELGAIPLEHRTDNLTAATQAMGSSREFTSRWQQFMQHYAVTPTTNNRGVSHENGSIEKSHDTLKNAIDQELLLRGHRDFDSQTAYMAFIEKLVASRNALRQARLLEEVDLLADLPNRRWHSPTIVTVKVSHGSVIQLFDTPYTVPSRLIGYTLKAYLYPDEIVVFYANKSVLTMPRSAPKSLAGINYRHLIDSLLRKPAAFAHYQYHEALFPQLCFRKAYDVLRSVQPATADRAYLQLLHLATLHSEQEVSVALGLLSEARQVPTPHAVKDLLDAYIKERAAVYVHQPDLMEYDALLSSSLNEVLH